MMDIDSPPHATSTPSAATTTTTSTTQIKIHPLAIIGISDHQTRIATGGSPLTSLPSSSSSKKLPPIVGLLFGYQNGITISIVDAEEIQINYTNTTGNADIKNIVTPEQKKNIQTKIELHQKVFPNHEVIGWYRVDVDDKKDSEDEDEEILPVEMDLIMTNVWMKEYNESPLFVLMDANEKKPTNTSDSNAAADSANEDANKVGNVEGEKDPKKTKNNEFGENAREQLDRDEQLPLAVYETMTTGCAASSDTSAAAANAGMVFVNLDFELETFEPERIAVERVFQTQPKNVSGGTTTTSTNVSTTASTSAANPEDAASASTGPAVTTESKASTVQTQTESAAGTQIQSLITSIEAMNVRIAVLLDFLYRTQRGEIPPNHALLRQVRSLVNQLPLVMGKGTYNTIGTAGTAEDEKEEKMRNETLAKEFENEYDDMLVVSFLATIAKTTKAVLSYSEKFKVVNENSGASNTGKDSFAKGRGYDHFKDDL